ncbi:MAG TPA: hypothetical protein VJ984_11150 [Xanthomonadales bacterium]|nr:hypothetical protein [Xanthomonadales bacterium]
MKTERIRFNQSSIPALLAIFVAVWMCATSSVYADEESQRSFRESDLRGTWTMAGWVEATLLIPFPGEITHSVGPGDPVNPGDKVALKGTLVGLFEFNGSGAIVEFNDLFKPGGIEPLSPPFPIPWVPPLTETGHGSYTVDANGMVSLSTEIIDPASGNLAGEADYNCVLNRSPKRLDCIFARFKTYVVDPAGFDAPITGQVTMMPQR